MTLLYACWLSIIAVILIVPIVLVRITKEEPKITQRQSLNSSLSAIKLAIQEKIPLRVSATITKHTMHDIGYLSRLAKELGFSLYFSILLKNGN